MKAAEYYICLALGAIAMVLAVLVFFTGRSTEALQARLTAQQEEINKGSMSQQVGANLLRDTAQVAVTNPRMRELLQRNGITLSPAPAPTAPAAPAATPAPVPAPAKK